jgi:hypothetical protein
MRLRRVPSNSRKGASAAAGPIVRVGRFAVVCLLLHLGGSRSADAQEHVNREYKIKAAYLYNFGRYVEWPAEAFADARSPFVIGVLEPDPVGVYLDLYARSSKVGERPIHVRSIKNPEQAPPCHILFFPRDVDPEVRRATIRRLSGSHVLFVGEADSFLDEGGVIDFVIRQNNVRLVVALKSARREKLGISSKLLQVAQVVD